MKINNNFEKELDNQTINERLFDILDKKGVKPVDLSRGTGIAPNTISNWKTLKTNPSADKIPRICEFLNITCEYLLTGIDKKGMEGESQMLTTMQQSAMAKLIKLNDSGVLMLNGYLDGLLAHDDFQSELAG